jgi:hypothetical protein
MNPSSPCVSNVNVVSNVHVRQRGIAARDDLEFRRHIFSRNALFALFPELAPGPAGVDRGLVRRLLSGAQAEFFEQLPCHCGRRDYWYVRSGAGHRVVRCRCMCGI